MGGIQKKKLKYVSSQKHIKEYMILRALVGTLALLVLDVIWIRQYMGPRYANMISNIQGGNPMLLNKKAALGAYVLMVLGLNTFVLPASDDTRPLSHHALRAFVYGAVLYGVYDLTAGAIFENWDWSLALLDVIWGGSVFAAAVAIADWLAPRRSKDSAGYA